MPSLYVVICCTALARTTVLLRFARSAQTLPTYAVVSAVVLLNIEGITFCLGEVAKSALVMCSIP